MGGGKEQNGYTVSHNRYYDICISRWYRSSEERVPNLTWEDNEKDSEERLMGGGKP